MGPSEHTAFSHGLRFVGHFTVCTMLSEDFSLPHQLESRFWEESLTAASKGWCLLQRTWVSFFSFKGKLGIEGTIPSHRVTRNIKDQRESIVKIFFWGGGESTFRITHAEQRVGA